MKYIQIQRICYNCQHVYFDFLQNLFTFVLLYSFNSDHSIKKYSSPLKSPSFWKKMGYIKFSNIDNLRKLCYIVQQNTLIILVLKNLGVNVHFKKFKQQMHRCKFTILPLQKHENLQR